MSSSPASSLPAPAVPASSVLPPNASNPSAPNPGVPALCVIVPVLNEEGNVARLVERLRTVLAGIAWEVLFVDDDSTDRTREIVAGLAAADPRVRLLHRIGRRGLSSAFIEGALASTAPVLAAMDGDLQHDETLLPKMFAALTQGDAELAVGSRYVAGGGLGEWDATRASMSGFATKLAALVMKAPCTDPMSGFFMLRRATFLRAVRGLSALGFKILLDLLATLDPPPRIAEFPYQFRTRTSGESKLDAGVLRDYAMLLADKMLGHIVPVRFLLFAAVGALGIAGHLVVLLAGLRLAGFAFPLAQSVATAAAILANFFLNNAFTFRENRLRGWRMLGGLVSFALICSVGAVANVSVSSFLFGPEVHSAWWIAGIAGAAMSLVWNYAVSSVITWRRR